MRKSTVVLLLYADMKNGIMTTGTDTAVTDAAETAAAIGMENPVMAIRRIRVAADITGSGEKGKQTRPKNLFSIKTVSVSLQKQTRF